MWILFLNMASRIYLCTLICLLTLGGCAEGRPTDNTLDSSSLMNRTKETYDMYHPVANQTKEFFGNTSGRVGDTFHITDKMKNCSIVFGGAVGGGILGMLIVGIVVPLSLWIFRHPCWGCRAGSAAGCCQSGIGDVPAGGNDVCCQSLDAEDGGLAYLIISTIVGIPSGLYIGGWVSEMYFHCFDSP